jgi:hypothetical protein
VNGSAAAWAFAQHVHPVSTKFVLVALACFASRKWLTCLSVSDIAKKTSLKRSIIFEALAELKKLGLIQPIGAFEGQLPIYSVNPSTYWTGPVHTVDESRPQAARVNGSLPPSSPPSRPPSSTLSLFPDTPPLPPQGGNGVSVVSPRQTRKPKSTEPSEDFLQFWDEYPRHKKMKDAWKAWQQTNPPLSVVLESLAEHKKSQDWRRGQQFIPYPATWLRAEQWDDEL